MKTNITDQDEEIRQLILTADPSTARYIFVFMVVAMANLMVEKLSYYFSKEVKEDGED